MKLVHQRSIDISIYAVGDDAVLVIGRLVDRRGYDLTTFSGRDVPAGDELHGMEVELKVGRDLVVQDASARMPFIPESGCDKAALRLKGLVGLRLGSGFPRAARQRIAGDEGCQHLTALVMAIAPAAIQGYWAHFGSPIRTGDLEPLLDTCHVFRAESPFVERIRASLKKRAKSGASDSAGPLPAQSRS